ncbi:tripartite tricarboxylate transporter substrate-binding protein [Variovorax sp. J22P240]|uniref:Bug family tripartite tricarboxylate transporter substrate binding protein n=1 Tax=Variovorax sp. J22P240 TaxID=3053514 RepID=UPI002575A47F|nr:tripartite tricarboxylate transporter substrate-binding protein [Variovorax sp. J22P240]MDL9999952.1 tripartite tricarboxylate transporter substrate-binding protein [Variovorax sp. J22P240]
MHHLLRHLTLAATSSLRQTAQAFEPPASTYPTRPIRMVVDSLRSGAIENIARMVAGKLGVEFGQSVDFDSRPDVGGTLGLAAVARAAPDGYTLLMSSNTTMSIAPHLFNQLPSNPRVAFVPVALVSLLPCGVVVNSSTPAPDLQGRIEWLKKCGGKIDGVYAPPGTPGAIVDKLAAAIRRTVRTADVRAQLAKQGVDLVLLTGPAARAFLDQEDESRAAAVRA